MIVTNKGSIACNLQFPADLVTFTEETLNEKHHFLSSDDTYLMAIKVHYVGDTEQQL